MQIKPEFQDSILISCLQEAFGLNIIRLAFLPIGGDLSTAVYRAAAEDGTAYFCKLKQGTFDPISVELPKFLYDQGIAQIIAPLSTKTGRLWAEFDEIKLILYPYIEGTSGFDVELSGHQWAEFGAALKRVHTTSMPPVMIRNMQKERYSPEWRDECRTFIKRITKETFDDPVAAGLVEFLRPKLGMVLDLIERAERLAQDLASRSLEMVLCHSDIHPGNLFLDRQGGLFIVDWDYPLLAPKERDLMFIGGGQGYVGVSAQEEETFFYRHYGQAAIDPIAMAYYRYERSVIDICVECTRIFSSTLGVEERAHSLEIITWGFLPGSTVEMAYRSDKSTLKKGLS